MKNNKIISLFIMTIIIAILSINVVYASFADFTDEQADKQAQEQIKEQEKEHNITEVKSSDNYLTNLQVEGCTLTPEFDKQTLEYTIKEEFNASEINIKATPSNEKATINGAGTIKIEEEKNEYRVDVKAENGSVRTYIIKLKEITPNNNESNNEFEQKDKITTEIQNENSEQQENNETNSSNIIMYAIISVIVIILLILVFRKGKKKGKH